MGKQKKETKHKSKKASRESKHHKHHKHSKERSSSSSDSSSASEQVAYGPGPSNTISADIPTKFSDNYYDFPKAYNGLLEIIPSGRVILFDRMENKKLAQLLDAFSDDGEKQLLIVQGPPGVGKSKETLLWLLLRINLSPIKLVMCWIRLEKTATLSNYIVYTITGDTVGKVKFTIQTIAKAKLSPHLTAQNFTCVVFDNAIDDNKEIILECRNVLNAFNRTTKIIAVSSTQLKQDSSIKWTTQSCVVEGWTLEEFIDACSDDSFYNHVKSNLLTSDFDTNDMNKASLRRDIVVAKHSIAGASARWMFECTEDELLDIGGDVSSIEYHISRVGAEEMMKGINGVSTQSSVNHLVTQINNVQMLTSRYVATSMADLHSIHLLRSCLAVMGGDSNPGGDGVLLEMDFIMRLGRETRDKREYVELVERRRHGYGSTRYRSGSAVHKYRLNTKKERRFFKVASLREWDWFVPKLFNYGGFDCVQYSQGTLRFVQVTRSSTHSFNLDWYQKFCTQFCTLYTECTIVKCYVDFVVPTENVNVFKPDTSKGGLSNFDGVYRVYGIARTIPL